MLRSAAFLALALLPATAVAETVPLAREGKAQVRIVLPERPSPAARLAGDELARYLGRMTGGDFAVQEGAPPAKGAIVLSVTGRGDPEAYRIAAEKGSVRLEAGGDRGVLFAAYDLLAALGCRWLAPEYGFYQGAAEVVPRSPSLAFTLDQPRSEAPALKFRKLYVEEGHSHTAETLRRMVEWMPRLRYNTLVVPTDYQGRGQVKWDNWREALTPELERRGLIIEVGGHGYQNFLNATMESGRLFTEHPEWFGQDAQGQRRREPGRVFCTSNPEAMRFVTGRFVDYVRARPEIRIFDFWPPDGARWCECEKCLALGSPSDRQAILLGQVKQAVIPVRPDLRLECLAYHTSITPPERAKLDPAVLLDFCPISQCFEVQIDDPASKQNADYAAALQAWRKAFAGEISVYSYYRKYAWKSLPVIFPDYIQADLKWYRKIPVQGVSTYCEPGDWATYELNHYGLGQLGWNPAVSLSQVRAEFAAARFGPAAAAAEAAWAALGTHVRQLGSLPGTSFKAPDDLRRGREALERVATRLRESRAGLTDPAHSAAVDRLLLDCEYARRDLEIQALRASRATPDEIRAKVEDLARFLAANSDRGVFTLHSRLEAPRLLQSYGVRQ